LLSPKNSQQPATPAEEKLHQKYLSTAGRNMLDLQDTEILMTALQKTVHIAVAGLKGIYLLPLVLPCLTPD